MKPSAEDWQRWQSRLAAQEAPPPLDDLTADKRRSPLFWSLAAELRERPAAALIEQLHRFLHQGKGADAVIAQLTLWRATLLDALPGPELGLTAVAWAQALPKLASVLSGESWRGLVEDLLNLVHDAAGLSPEEEPLGHQLLAVELPLTLVHVAAEWNTCFGLGRGARKQWSWGAEELTDGEGLLRGRHLELTRPLLGCWTRCIALTHQEPEGRVDEDVQVQFEWLLRQALRLLRYDGSLCFCPPGKASDTAELIRAALRFSDDPQDHALAKAATEGVKLPSAAKKPKKSGKAEEPLPGPFVHSEWSAAGVLRGDWTLGAPRLAVTFDQQQVRCELDLAGKVLFSGPWTAEISINGNVVRPQADWEEVCWHADEDVLYLELETRLSPEWCLQRQIMLARQDRVLLLADALLGKARAQLEYRGTLPLAGGTRFRPADETREGFLADKKSLALVLPLALPEWRSQAGQGELTATEQGLTLSQSQSGQRLFAPLWIDLSSKRIRQDCTWRQLTVAEQLQIQPRDVAVAYRAQAGKEQWTVYRSLAPKANRTFLGHNIVTECQVARFLKDGTDEVLLEVE